MHAHLHKTIAVASLLFFSSLLNGCAINPDAKHKNAVSESACANTVKDFDSGTAPLILLTALPAGVYAHTAAEVYVDNKIASSTTAGVTDETELQFIETDSATTSIQCRETSGTFRAYFEQPTLVASFTRYPNADIAPVSNAYTVIYNTDLQPGFGVVQKTTGQRSNTSTVANLISSYWNASYHFVRSSTNTYIFYGVHTDSSTGRTVFGKAVYTRADLPVGTI